MSLIISPPPQEITPLPPQPEGQARLAGLWARVILALMLLGTAAAIRFWQGRRVDQALRAGRIAPFPLAELPKELGPWSGKEVTLDPRIARATGAVDLWTREYIDGRTGVAVSALVLYGPATEVYGHIPSLCYPTAGYTGIAGPETRVLKVAGVHVPFDAQVFAKGEGGQADWQEVYFTWHYGDRWAPDRFGNWKQVQRIPGLLKIQVARRVSPGEVRDPNELRDPGERRQFVNPIEDFLSRLIPEVQRRLAASAAARRPTS
ncbi:MAG: exosortase-associated EpsI family protein [Isosphaeraceae bacterium]|nr:exosortase-associated EpsI family protein [Isosphaeraceae bacterium]